MRWMTRERIRMDRAACAWMIRRFIDPGAQFMFVPGDGALERAKAENAVPFVIPGAEVARHGRRIGLDILVEQHRADDAALSMLAGIVRAADIRELRATVPEAAGLAAVLHGFFLLNRPDAETLDLELPLFDALYRYCQEQVIRGT